MALRVFLSGTIPRMSDLFHLMSSVERGDLSASEQLLPYVYHELRQMAAQLMTDERTDHTLTPTALVHEVYLRLSGSPIKEEAYRSESQFFAVVAQVMRRVLVDSARRKRSLKRGGQFSLVSFDEELFQTQTSQDILDLDEALELLAQEYPDLSELVSLRYFAGMTMPQAAQNLGMPLRTAERNWHFARAWLKAKLASQRE